MVVSRELVDHQILSKYGHEKQDQNTCSEPQVLNDPRGALPQTVKQLLSEFDTQTNYRSYMLSRSKSLYSGSVPIGDYVGIVLTTSHVACCTRDVVVRGM